MSSGPSADDNPAERLPEISPELALVDADLAHRLRERDRIVARRRRLPFPALHLVPDTPGKIGPEEPGVVEP